MPNFWSYLKEWTRRFIPAPAARSLRPRAAFLRARQQKRRASEGWRQYGDRYPYPLLYVAGLPKSGTTWMEKMLASYSGFAMVSVPEAIAYEVEQGGSHDYDLPENTFTRFEQTLSVLKLHVHGSTRNVELLHDANIPYLIMYRDLRDVAVSHYFYVRRTPWHPEHPTYKLLDMEQGLLHFGQTLLSDFVAWVQSWEENRDSDLSLIIRYEDLLENTDVVFRKVASLFGLDNDSDTINKIVEAHRFERLSGGREKGQQSASSFFRKGVSGDWKTHFTPRVEQVFSEKAGEFFEERGFGKG